jgi:hypothetical protein
MSAVLMAVGLAACGSSSKKSESSTTTAASSNTSTPTTIKTVPVDCGGTPAAATEVTR